MNSNEPSGASKRDILEIADHLGGLAAGVRLLVPASPRIHVGQDGTNVSLRFRLEEGCTVDDVIVRLRLLVKLYDEACARAT